MAVALENARLFDRERQYSATLETLAEIGHEVASILELDELLEHIAVLARRLVDYRTFGILLLNEAAQELEIKLAIRYEDRAEPAQGQGGRRHRRLRGAAQAAGDRARRVGGPAVHPRSCPTAARSSRSRCSSRTACVGVFDLESPELDAFNKEHVEILTLLASQAAVAIENARLYETIRANELRIESELRFAQRVQAALLPTGLPKRLRGIDVAARFAPARELGGDLHDFLSAEANSLVVAVGDVSGKGVPAALYSAFAGELVRSRTFRRRYTPERIDAGRRARVGERDPPRARARGVLLHALLRVLRPEAHGRADGQLGPAVPGLVARRTGARRSSCPGMPLGSFAGATYDEITLELTTGDVFVFCSDGIYEAFSPEGDEFGAARVCDIVQANRHQPARADRRRDLRGRGGLQGRAGAERRHDRRRRQVHRLTPGSGRAAIRRVLVGRGSRRSPALRHPQRGLQLLPDLPFPAWADRCCSVPRVWRRRPATPTRRADRRSSACRRRPRSVSTCAAAPGPRKRV